LGGSRGFDFCVFLGDRIDAHTLGGAGSLAEFAIRTWLGCGQYSMRKVMKTL
jgi:hypothetical protein